MEIHGFPLDKRVIHKWWVLHIRCFLAFRHSRKIRVSCWRFERGRSRSGVYLCSVRKCEEPWGNRYSFTSPIKTCSEPRSDSRRRPGACHIEGQIFWDTLLANLILRPHRDGCNISRSCDPCVRWPNPKRKAAIPDSWLTCQYHPPALPRIVFWQAKLRGVESPSTHKCRWIPCMVLAWSSAFSCPAPSISAHLDASPSCVDCFQAFAGGIANDGLCRWSSGLPGGAAKFHGWEVPAGRLKQR